MQPCNNLIFYMFYINEIILDARLAYLPKGENSNILVRFAKYKNEK